MLFTSATMKGVSAVTFDLWDTLIKEVPGGPEKVEKIRVEAISGVLDRAGIPHGVPEVRSAYEKCGMFLELAWSKRRDLPIREHVLFLLDCLDAKVAGRLKGHELDEIEKAYAEGLLRNPPRLLPGAKEALKSVRSKGYRLGLISNTGRTPGYVLRRVLAEMGVLDQFDLTSFSNELLVRKPAETIFRATLVGLRVPPKAAVHIGDNPEQDIEGARRVGMRTIYLFADGAKPCKVADASTDSIDDVLDLIEKF